MDDTSLTASVCSRRRHLGRLRACVSGLFLLGGALAAGCQPYIGTTAASFLRSTQSRDPNIRYLAYDKLASSRAYDSEDEKALAVKALTKALDDSREPVACRAVICRTLGDIGRPDARPALVRSTNDPEGVVRAEACRALGKVGQPQDATILARIMSADTLEDCRIAAIEGLGALRTSDLRIMRLLAEGMEHQDPAIRLASLQSLRKLTKKDLGVEPTPWLDYVRELADKEEKGASKIASTEGRKGKPADPNPLRDTPDVKTDAGVLPAKR